ncbi:OTU domain-containing protein 5, partial [Trichinella nelsoni]
LSNVMTILPKKKGGSKDSRSQSHDHSSSSSNSGSLNVEDAALIGLRNAQHTTVDSPTVPRRPVSHSAYDLPEGESVFFGSGSRKRLATVNPGRQERGHRTKQKNLSHTLPSTSTAPVKQGYNSEDEYDEELNTGVDEDQLDRNFEDALKTAKGFIIKKMKADGACLFRAVADQVYGDQEMHDTVRKLCINYMKKNSDYFSQFVTESFSDYIARKSLSYAHGNHIEMQAMAELFNRPIEVYQYNIEPINTFLSNKNTNDPPIRLSYHRSIHYNSVVDPFKATIGVGLGLPQYFPGLAERNLMDDARLISERDVIEEAMLKDKMDATDWEATDEQLQEQIACESYLQWLADERKRHGNVAEDVKGANSSKDSSATEDNMSRKLPACGDTAQDLTSQPSTSQFLLNDYNLTGWNAEEELLNHVLALSQQEYIDSLSHKREDEDSACCSSRDAVQSTTNIASEYPQSENSNDSNQTYAKVKGLNGCSRVTHETKADTASALFDAVLEDIKSHESCATASSSVVAGKAKFGNRSKNLVSEAPATSHADFPEAEALPDSQDSQKSFSRGIANICLNEEAGSPSVDAGLSSPVSATNCSKRFFSDKHEQFASSVSPSKRKATQLKEDRQVDASSVYSFEEEEEEEEDKVGLTELETDVEYPTKFLTSKTWKSVYQHKWNTDSSSPNAKSSNKTTFTKKEVNAAKAKHDIATPSVSVSKFHGIRQRKTVKSVVYGEEISQNKTQCIRKEKPLYTVVRNVKQAHECHESGEAQEYNDDVVYLLGALSEENTSNMRCLSLITLLQKCVSAAFRNFLKAHGYAKQVLHALKDAHGNDCLALATACLFYLLSRDRLCLVVDECSLGLLVNLVKPMKVDVTNEEFLKCKEKIWKVLCDWRTEVESSNIRKVLIMFDLTEKNLNTSFLALESLVFISSRSDSDAFKQEMRLNGGVEIAALRVADETKKISKAKGDEACIYPLLCLQRALRILENVTTKASQNKGYLVTNDSLGMLDSLLTLFDFCLNGIIAKEKSMPNVEDKNSPSAQVSSLLLIVFSELFRLLCNLSNNNEICCSKLSASGGFIRRCVECVTFYIPRYLPESKRYDMQILFMSFVINYIEHHQSGRRVVIHSEVQLLDGDKVISLPTVQALTRRIANAQSADDEMNNEIEGSSQTTAKSLDMQQKSFQETVKAALVIASKHMEECTVAAHVGLILGLLMQEDELVVFSMECQVVLSSLLLVDHFPKHPEYSKFCREERDEYKKKQANEVNNAKEQQREHKVTSTSENSDYNHALSTNSTVSHGRVSNYYSQHDRVTPPAVVAPSTSSVSHQDMSRENDETNDTYSTFNVDDLIELENANNRAKTVGIPPTVVENLQAAESSSRPPKPTFDRSTKPKLKTKTTTTTTSTPVRPPLPVVAPPPSSTPVSKYSGLQPVIIPKNLVFRFLDAAALNTAQEIETCGILSGKLIQSSFVVTHVIVPKQSEQPNALYEVAATKMASQTTRKRKVATSTYFDRPRRGANKRSQARACESTGQIDDSFGTVVENESHAQLNAKGKRQKQKQKQLSPKQKHDDDDDDDGGVVVSPYFSNDDSEYSKRNKRKRQCKSGLNSRKEIKKGNSHKLRLSTSVVDDDDDDDGECFSKPANAKMRNKISECKPRKKCDKNNDDSDHVVHKKREKKRIAKVKVVETNSSDSEWEDVKDVEIIDRPSTSTSTIQLHVKQPENPSASKKKTLLQRLVSKVTKLARIRRHKVYLLAEIAHGIFLSKCCNDEQVRATAMSLIPIEMDIREPELRTRNFASKFIRWFHKNYPLKYLEPCGSLSTDPIDYLLSKMSSGKIYSFRDWTLVFVSFARCIGFDVRIIMALHPTDMFDLSVTEVLVTDKLNEKKPEKRKKFNSSSRVNDDRSNQDELGVSVERKVADCQSIPPNNMCSAATHYCFSFDNEHAVRDVTIRYASNYGTVDFKRRRLSDSWFQLTLDIFQPANKLRNRLEDLFLEKMLSEKPLPKKRSDYKNHPLYVLKRDLLKFEALYPADLQPVGYIGQEAVYPRTAVMNLKGKEAWIREARVIKANEQPYKVVKGRPKMTVPKELRVDRPLNLYGIWQTEPYIPKPAEDGIVPKNEYGNVELYQMSMLPPGTVYMIQPGLLSIARKLNIDCAPAVVGWEFHCRSSHPIVEGCVVCKEHKEILEAAWLEEQIHIAVKEKERKTMRALKNWRKMVRSVLIKAKVEKKFLPSTKSAQSELSQSDGQLIHNQRNNSTASTSVEDLNKSAWPQCRHQFDMHFNTEERLSD